MAKGKRKISAAQRDKVAIETAKILKRKGVLSKSTKLHGGKYISRDVLKKVQEFQHVARPSWTAVKVSKDVARTAKAEGYQVVNDRVIAPKDHDFIKRIRKGMVSGVKPVKGGFMSEVQVTFTGKNTADLIKWLEEGNLDELKLEQEQFAFRLSGPEGSPIGMSYRAFLDKAAIMEYLQYYAPDVDTTGFKLYRLHPEDRHKFIISKGERFKYKKEHGLLSRRKGPKEKPHGWRRSRAAMKRERLRETSPARYEALLEKERAKAKAKRERKKNDPVYREKERKRALENYYKNKGRK